MSDDTGTDYAADINKLVAAAERGERLRILLAIAEWAIDRPNVTGADLEALRAAIEPSGGGQ